MAATMIGDLVLPDTELVYALYINHWQNYTGIIFSRPAIFELNASLTIGSEISIGFEKTEDSAHEKLADYATKLGLHMLARDYAVRRSNLVAAFVTSPNPRFGLQIWRVFLRFNVGKEDIEYSRHDTYDRARASLDAINAKLFPAAPADVPAIKATSVTPQ